VKKLWLVLSKIFLFLFLIFIPTQLGKHFWPEWSYVLGMRVDYLSPTLYFLDLIWFGLFLVESLSSWKVYQVSKTNPSVLRTSPLTGRFIFGNLLLILFVIINILIAGNKGIAIYRWLRIGQLVWTIKYFRLNKIEVKKILVKVLPVWIIIESLIGFAQVIKGGSLNGIFYWLGERSFSFNTIGIAQISVIGQGLVRAYGTFSHPNSLAGFLLVSLLFWTEYKNNLTSLKSIKFRIWWWLVAWLGLIGIIISGSRIIWLLAVLSLIYLVYQFKKIKDKKYFWGGILISLGVVLIIYGLISTNYPSNRLLGGWDSESLSKRWDLNITSIEMIKDSLWLGKGAGNFLVELPRFQVKNSSFWLQPVHNIFLLILSEIGMIGMLIFNFQFKIFENIKKIFKNKTNRWLILIILITGLWDHYWITLSQNYWLLGLVLAII
jgi:hypothetical protein